MKLHNLFENDDIRKVMEKNLVQEVDFYSPRGPQSYVMGIYAISDVPPISQQQFRKLYETSFEPNPSTLDFYTPTSFHRYASSDGQDGGEDHIQIIMRTSEDSDWYRRYLETHEKGNTQFMGNIKWKQFANKMRADYPYNKAAGDDFAEVR